MIKTSLQLGAARISVVLAASELRYGSQIGYVRVLGCYFDFWRYSLGPVHVQIMRPRESDGHHLGKEIVDRLDFHCGYRSDDRAANPSLPTYRNYF